MDRIENSSIRKLQLGEQKTDFSSNDYLGFAKSESLFADVHDFLDSRNIKANGSTGSRLLSGNHPLFEETENAIAQFQNSETALLFNSGYDANLGFFSAVPQRNDVILYDELSHASIRDGIRMSHSRAFRFAHNDLEDLELLIQKFKSENYEIYIATESVFSMDGDSPDLEKMADLSNRYHCHLVVDEAHALGVFGNNGEGLVQQLHLEDKVFARIMTFGKGLGCHGAAILGSEDLRTYLINFARSFIYTTALPLHAVATILLAYKKLEDSNLEIEKLRDNILFFSRQKNSLGLKPLFVRNKSAIQSAIIPGNERVKKIAAQLQESGFDVRPILSPTVPEGQERLRICLHSYNSEAEITAILERLVICL